MKRNATPALTYDDIGVGMYIEEVVSFKRSYQNEEILVLHHVSDVEVTVTVDEKNLFSENIFNTAGDRLTIPNWLLMLPCVYDSDFREGVKKTLTLNLIDERN